MDLEPPPPFLSSQDAKRLGYGAYSCRYGNVYTTRQLLQLLLEAIGVRAPGEVVWMKGDRFFDALRPGIEPGGFGSEDEVLTLRAAHLRRVRQLFETLDLFVFTLGLTETWISETDGTAYPTAPGVIAGEYKPGSYRLLNCRYKDVYEDLTSFVNLLRRVNPKAKLLLTVSPVPLAATGTGDHVLVASTYSKSTLRAAAGDIQADVDGVFYFPSYEIIAGHPTRSMYYNPDLRTVAAEGVAQVMKHFFNGVVQAEMQSVLDVAITAQAQGFEQCEESLLDITPGER